MRLIKIKTLKQFWDKHTDSQVALNSWANIVKRKQWDSFNDIKKTFGSADVIAGNRCVFNIKGNKYRLVVKVHYNTKIMYIRFIGTHSEYDRIDVEKI